MSRADDGISLRTITDERAYSAQHVIDILDGGTRPATRTTMTASYYTTTPTPTVYYTALKTDGTVLTARTTSGVTLSACGDYVYSQDITGLDHDHREFVAIWDEGSVPDFVLERIVVDT